MDKKVYTVIYKTKEGTAGRQEFTQRGDAVAFQIRCIKEGMIATISSL